MNIARAAAWGWMALITVLSLAPQEKLVRTGMGGHLEHVTAYIAAALLVGWAYRERNTACLVSALMAYAGLLEALQHFSPGREATLGGFAASSLGIVVGFAALRVLAKWETARRARAHGFPGHEPRTPR
jgi:VanZ family protein